MGRNLNLIFAILLFDPGIALAASDCKPLLSIEGFTVETDHADSVVQKCNVNKDTVELRVRLWERSPKIQKISKADFERRMTALDRAVSEIEPPPPGKGEIACSHKIHISLSVGAAARTYAFCEKSPNFVSARKFIEFSKALYYKYQ